MSKSYRYVCPCKDCEKRQQNCHSFCDNYKDWKRSGVEVVKGVFYECIKKKKKRR